MLDIIRRFKLSYEVYNFFQKKKLVHNVGLYEKYGIQKKYYSSISSEDFESLDEEKNEMDTKDVRIELPKNPDFNLFSKQLQDELLEWSDKGYVILKNFFSAEEVTAINAEVDRLITSKKANWRYGGKIMFAIHQSELLREMGVSGKLVSLLNLLMGKEVKLFQSINFIEASEQRTHSDSIHMSTFPLGNLTAAWIALEDVSAENGALHYYPGSHKLPYVMNKDFDNAGSRFRLGKKTYRDYENKIEEIVTQYKLKKEIFNANKGDVLIWHANLLHGGEPLLDKKRTRKSMVFHYYTNDAICYHEVTQRPALKL